MLSLFRHLDPKLILTTWEGVAESLTIQSKESNVRLRIEVGRRNNKRAPIPSGPPAL
jgi:hypothetical protein